MGSIFKNALICVGVFLQTMFIGVGIAYGDQFVSSMLWGAICFFIPLFGLWGLPQVTFWVRLFRSSDFISVPVQQVATQTVIQALTPK